MFPAQADTAALDVGLVAIDADHIGVFPDFCRGRGNQAGAQITQTADALAHADAEGAVLGQEVFQFGATEQLGAAVGEGVGHTKVQQHPRIVLVVR
ncbi:hypothetical protein D3C75_1058900 [compost metagenome]